MLDYRVFILQEIFEVILFLMSRKFETQSCQWYGVKRTKFIFADKGNSATRFVEQGTDVFITSSIVFVSSNKTISNIISLTAEKDSRMNLYIFYKSLNQYQTTTASSRKSSELRGEIFLRMLRKLHSRASSKYLSNVFHIQTYGQKRSFLEGKRLLMPCQNCVNPPGICRRHALYMARNSRKAWNLIRKLNIHNTKPTQQHCNIIRFGRLEVDAV